jgi:hypothetical protein
MSPKADQKSGAEEFFGLPWSREVLADNDGATLLEFLSCPVYTVPKLVTQAVTWRFLGACDRP